MPPPVSDTSTAIHWPGPGALLPSAAVTLTPMPPRSVYLTAFESGLPTTWRIRRGSESITGSSPGTSIVSDKLVFGHEAIERLPEHLLDGVAEDLLHRRVGELDPALLVDHEDGGGGVLGQRPESFLAFPERVSRSRPLCDVVEIDRRPSGDG